MTVFLVAALICVGIWFFILTADGRKNLTDLFCKASKIVRKEMEERKSPPNR